MSLQTFLQSFNDLDPDNIGAWPRHVRVTIWIIAFLLVFALMYVWQLSDTLELLQGKKIEESGMISDYEKRAFQAVNLGGLKKQYADMQASFGALVKQLPSDTEVPALLEDISQLGANNGLEFESIDLGDEKAVEFYAELPIKITVKGGYHSLASFVSGIAALPRIVTLHDFSMEPIVANDLNSNVVRMSILAKTYRYNERK